MVSTICLLAIEVLATLPASAEREIQQPPSVLPLRERLAPGHDSALPFPIRDPVAVGRSAESGVRFREPLVQFDAEPTAPPAAGDPRGGGRVYEERASDKTPRFPQPPPRLAPQPMDVLNPPPGLCDCPKCQQQKKRKQGRRSSSANCSSPVEQRDT